MQQLTILSGAGINHGISAACPQARDLIDFTYQKISQSVYERIPSQLQAMFTQESFDYILGGLMTINLVVEKTKQDLIRFRIDQQAFANIFQQSSLQDSIIQALDQIETQLTVSLRQMLEVVRQFDPAIRHLDSRFDSVNYFTLNFDGVFDHIIYGERYVRGAFTTDFWSPWGDLREGIDRKFKIMHLHGDLRYKPFKKTQYNDPPYRWPVLVVGDAEVKKGIIASNTALRFYNQRLREACENRDRIQENVLLVAGFGFREEDQHVVSKIKAAVNNGIFDRMICYDIEDKFADWCPRPYEWRDPRNLGLNDLLHSI